MIRAIGFSTFIAMCIDGYHVCLLKDCVKTKALEEGKRIHGHIYAIGFKPDIFIEEQIAAA